MSRGGRGGGRGGRGGFRGGGGGAFGTGTMPPMGLTFAEVQAMSREADTLYPDYSEEEKRICELQNGFATRLRKSAYYVSGGRKFFPQEIFESYFNPKKKRRTEKKPKLSRLHLDDFVEDAEEQEKSGDEGSIPGSQQAESDYDVDEEYDNDYADNYFDNGEGDDLDDMVGGGGDDGGGGNASSFSRFRVN
ncbi:hypothetical protein EDC04DRAFT_2877918 [Pisolithus marmoratus]|nr:hypothetical protein EDC04DRAFT_2877918 [Pisolithus marmoratus]